MFLNDQGSQTFRRGLSICLIVAFFFTGLFPGDFSASAVEKVVKSPSLDLNVSSFEKLLQLNLTSARLQKTFKGQNQNKFIILLQDLHCQSQAQLSIAQTLRQIQNKLGLNQILLEGAEGPFQMSLIQAFPENAVRERVARHFLEEGYFTGAEYEAIRDGWPGKFELLGVEETSLYLHNLKAFREVKMFYRDLKPQLEQWEREIQRSITEKSSSDLQFLIQSEKYFREEGKLTSETISRLKETLKKNHQSLPDSVKSMMDLKEQGETFSQTKIELEQKSLLEKLSKGLVKEDMKEFIKKQLEYRLGSLKIEGYHAYLKSIYEKMEKNFEKDFPLLEQYFSFLEKQEKLDLEKLIETCLSDLKNMIERMVQKENLQDKWKLKQEWDLVNDFIQLKLPRKDLEKIRQLDLEKFQKSLIGLSSPSALIGDPIPNSKKMDSRLQLSGMTRKEQGSEVLGLQKLIQSSQHFYEYALERDKVMTENTLKNIKHSSSILITGGFHTEGIQKILEGKGISYITLTPKVAELSSDVLYEKLMMDRSLYESIHGDNSVDSSSGTGAPAFVKRRTNGQSLERRNISFDENEFSEKRLASRVQKNGYWTLALPSFGAMLKAMAKGTFDERTQKLWQEMLGTPEVREQKLNQLLNEWMQRGENKTFLESLNSEEIKNILRTIGVLYPKELSGQLSILNDTDTSQAEVTLKLLRENYQVVYPGLIAMFEIYFSKVTAKISKKIIPINKIKLGLSALSDLVYLDLLNSKALGLDLDNEALLQLAYQSAQGRIKVMSHLSSETVKFLTSHGRGFEHILMAVDELENHRDYYAKIIQNYFREYLLHQGVRDGDAEAYYGKGKEVIWGISEFHSWNQIDNCLQGEKTFSRTISEEGGLGLTDAMDITDTSSILALPYIAYAKEIKHEVNPDDRPLTAVYAGAGADISGFLLSTNATRALFLDRTPFYASDLKQICEDPEEWGKMDIKNDSYLSSKRKEGFSTAHEAASSKSIMKELKALGISRDSITVAIDSENRVTLNFEWSYPGTKSKKNYSITFIRFDIADLGKTQQDIVVRQTLEDGIDIFYQSAGMNMRDIYEQYLPVIGHALKPGGVIVTDDSTLSDFDNSKNIDYAKPFLESSGNTFHSIPATLLMNWWVPLMSLRYPYGSRKIVYRKERNVDSQPSGLIGKLYLDPDFQEVVTGGVIATESNGVVTFTTVDGHKLFSREGQTENLRLEDEAITFSFNNWFNQLDLQTRANFDREIQEDSPLRNYFRAFLTRSQVKILPENSAVKGFSDGKVLYLTRELLENPIALFHEVCEGYFYLHPKELPEGVTAHTYLRGVGKDIRNLPDVDQYADAEALIKYIQSKLPPGRHNEAEFALIRYNASRTDKKRTGRELLYGLQDEIFGEEANNGFTDEIAAEKKIDETIRGSIPNVNVSTTTTFGDEGKRGIEEETQESDQEVEALLQEKSTLAFTDNSSGTDAIDQRLRAYAKKTNKPYIRVNLRDLDEMNALITHVIVNEDGTYESRPGPLIEVIRAGGIVLIDYQDAHPQAAIQLNSLFDAQGYLTSKWGKVEVPEALKIVGAMPASQIRMFDTSIYSRFRNQLDLDWRLNEVLNISEAPKDLDGVEVELYESSFYDETLIGSFYLNTDGKIVVRKGKLIEAIENGKPLIIQGGLWDNEGFVRFLRQVIQDGGIEFNGKFYALPRDFKIFKRKTKYEEGVFEKRIEDDSVIPENKPVWMINQAVQDILFSSVRIDNATGKMVQESGILDQDEGPICLWVTSHLSDWVWHRIMHSKRPIQICLAPGVDVPLVYQKYFEGKMRLKSEVYPSDWDNVKTLKTIVVDGSDKAFVLAKLTQEYPNHVVYPITPVTSVSDITSSIEIEKGRHFQSQAKQILEDLRAGKTVILEGIERNPELGQHLPTLFLSTPYLMTNGKRIDLKELPGRLILVGPLGLYPHARDKAILSPQENEIKMMIQKEFNQASTVSQDHAEAAEVISDSDYSALQELMKELESACGTSPSEIKSRLERGEVKYAFPVLGDGEALKRLYPERFAWGLAQMQQLCRYCQRTGHLGPKGWREAIEAMIISRYEDFPELAAFMRVQMRLKFPVKEGRRGIDGRRLKAITNEIVYPMTLHDRYWQLVDTMSDELLADQKIPHSFPANHKERESALNQIRYAQIGNAESEEKADFYRAKYGIKIPLEPYESASIAHEPTVMLGEDMVRDIASLPSAFVTKHGITPVKEVSEKYPVIFDETLSDPIQSREEKCVRLLEVYPAIFLRGPPGVGKSYLSQQLAERLKLKNYGPVSVGADISEEDVLVSRQFNSEEGALVELLQVIAKWALDPEGGLLAIDEANLSHPEFWSFFKGIFEAKPYIWMNGRQHFLTQNHKIVFTGNQEKMTGRRFQKALELVPVVNFEEFDQAFYEKKLREYLGSEQEKYTSIIYDLFLTFKKMGEGRSFSLRDIQEIAYRVRAVPATSIQQTVEIAWEVMRGLFSPEERIALQHIISKKYGVQILKETQTRTGLPEVFRAEGSPPIVYTESVLDFQETIQQFLRIRERRLQDVGLAESIQGKRGLLFEGPSGRGKDLVAAHLLEKSGYQKGDLNAPEEKGKNPKKFYHITTSLNYDDMAKVIERAAREGAIVILSEMNQIPSNILEGKLNAILTGDAAPGFSLIGTINSTDFGGRERLSTALQNRLIYHRINDYTQAELQEILRESLGGKISPDALTRLVRWHCYLRDSISNPSERPTIRELIRAGESMVRGVSIENAFAKIYGPVYFKILKMDKKEFDQAKAESYQEPPRVDNAVALEKIAQMIIPVNGQKVKLAWDPVTKNGGYYNALTHIIALSTEASMGYDLQTLDHEASHGLFTHRTLFPHDVPFNLYMWLEDHRMENALRHHFPKVDLSDTQEIAFVEAIQQANFQELVKMRLSSVFLYCLSTYARGWVGREAIEAMDKIWEAHQGKYKPNPFKLALKYLDVARAIIGVDPSVRAQDVSLQNELGMIPLTLDQEEIEFQYYRAVRAMQEYPDMVPPPTRVHEVNSSSRLASSELAGGGMGKDYEALVASEKNKLKEEGTKGIVDPSESALKVELAKERLEKLDLTKPPAPPALAPTRVMQLAPDLASVMRAKGLRWARILNALIFWLVLTPWRLLKKAWKAFERLDKWTLEEIEKVKEPFRRAQLKARYEYIDQMSGKKIVLDAPLTLKEQAWRPLLFITNFALVIRLIFILHAGGPFLSVYAVVTLVTTMFTILSYWPASSVSSPKLSTHSEDKQTQTVVINDRPAIQDFDSMDREIGTPESVEAFKRQAEIKPPEGTENPLKILIPTVEENASTLRKLLKPFFRNQLEFGGKVYGSEGATLHLQGLIDGDPKRFYAKSGATEQETPKEIVFVQRADLKEWNPMLEVAFAYLFTQGFTVTVYRDDNVCQKNIADLLILKSALSAPSQCDEALIRQDLGTRPRGSYIVTTLDEVQSCVEAEFLHALLVAPEAEKPVIPASLPVVIPEGSNPESSPLSEALAQYTTKFDPEKSLADVKVFEAFEAERQKKLIIDALVARGIAREKAEECVRLVHINSDGGLEGKDKSKGVNNLLAVRLEDCPLLKDISFLKGMTRVHLVKTGTIEDIGALKELPNLKRVLCTLTHERQISVLESLSGLWVLSINGELSKNIRLNQLSSLMRFVIHAKDISNEEVLEYLIHHPNRENLKVVINEDNGSLRTYSWEPEGRTYLENLRAEQEGVIRTFLREKCNLTEAEIANALTRTPDGFLALNFKYHPHVADISDLRGMTLLKVLNLNGTKVSDISVLESIPYLGELKLRYTSIEDITSLGRLKNLRELYLRNTKVKVIWPLIGNGNLELLDLYGTDISESMVIALFENHSDPEKLKVIAASQDRTVETTYACELDPLNKNFFHIYTFKNVVSTVPVKSTKAVFFPRPFTLDYTERMHQRDLIIKFLREKKSEIDEKEINDRLKIREDGAFVLNLSGINTFSSLEDFEEITNLAELNLRETHVEEPFIFELFWKNPNRQNLHVINFDGTEFSWDSSEVHEYIRGKQAEEAEAATMTAMQSHEIGARSGEQGSEISASSNRKEMQEQIFIFWERISGTLGGAIGSWEEGDRENLFSAILNAKSFTNLNYVKDLTRIGKMELEGSGIRIGEDEIAILESLKNLRELNLKGLEGTDEPLSLKIIFKLFYVHPNRRNLVVTGKNGEVYGVNHPDVLRTIERAELEEAEKTGAKGESVIPEGVNRGSLPKLEITEAEGELSLEEQKAKIDEFLRKLNLTEDQMNLALKVREDGFLELRFVFRLRSSHSEEVPFVWFDHPDISSLDLKRMTRLKRIWFNAIGDLSVLRGLNFEKIEVNTLTSSEDEVFELFRQHPDAKNFSVFVMSGPGGLLNRNYKIDDKDVQKYIARKNAEEAAVKAGSATTTSAITDAERERQKAEIISYLKFNRVTDEKIGDYLKEENGFFELDLRKIKTNDTRPFKKIKNLKKIVLNSVIQDLSGLDGLGNLSELIIEHVFSGIETDLNFNDYMPGLGELFWLHPHPENLKVTLRNERRDYTDEYTYTYDSPEVKTYIARKKLEGTVSKKVILANERAQIITYLKRNGVPDEEVGNHLKEKEGFFNLALFNTNVKNIGFLNGLSNLEVLTLSDTFYPSDGNMDSQIGALFLKHPHPKRLKVFIFYKNGFREINSQSPEVLKYVNTQGGWSSTALSHDHAEEMEKREAGGTKQEAGITDAEQERQKQVILKFLREDLELDDDEIRKRFKESDQDGFFSLDLTHMQPKDIRVLSGLTNLRELNLLMTNVRDPDAFELFRENPNRENLVVTNCIGKEYTWNSVEVQVYVKAVPARQSTFADEKISDAERNRQRQEILKFLDKNKIDRYKLKEVGDGFFVLDLNSAKVDDISALEGLTILKELNLSCTGVKDIRALSGLRYLKKLYLAGTGVKDTDIFELFRQNLNRGNLLVSHPLTPSSVRDYLAKPYDWDSPEVQDYMKKVASSQSTVAGEKISDAERERQKQVILKFLREDLELDEVQIKIAFKVKEGFFSLDLRLAKKIKNIHKLKGLTNLQELSFWMQPVKDKDIRALNGLNLTKLDLRDTQVQDLATIGEFFRQHPNHKSLTVYVNGFKDNALRWDSPEIKDYVEAQGGWVHPPKKKTSASRDSAEQMAKMQAEAKAAEAQLSPRQRMLLNMVGFLTSPQEVLEKVAERLQTEGKDEILNEFVKLIVKGASSGILKSRNPKAAKAAQAFVRKKSPNVATLSIPPSPSAPSGNLGFGPDFEVSHTEGIENAEVGQEVERDLGAAGIKATTETQVTDQAMSFVVGRGLSLRGAAGDAAISSMGSPRSLTVARDDTQSAVLPTDLTQALFKYMQSKAYQDLPPEIKELFESTRLVLFSGRTYVARNKKGTSYAHFGMGGPDINHQLSTLYMGQDLFLFLLENNQAALTTLIKIEMNRRKYRESFEEKSMFSTGSNNNTLRAKSRSAKTDEISGLSKKDPRTSEQVIQEAQVSPADLDQLKKSIAKAEIELLLQKVPPQELAKAIIASAQKMDDIGGSMVKVGDIPLGFLRGALLEAAVEELSKRLPKEELAPVVSSVTRIQKREKENQVAQLADQIQKYLNEDSRGIEFDLSMAEVRINQGKGRDLKSVPLSLALQQVLSQMMGKRAGLVERIYIDLSKGPIDLRMILNSLLEGALLTGYEPVQVEKFLMQRREMDGEETIYIVAVSEEGAIPRPCAEEITTGRALVEISA